jgi:hypothetical protein
MSTANKLDEEARAKLLCFLAVAQFAARARTDDWIRTDQSRRIWLHANSDTPDWFESVRPRRMVHWLF